ncbi:MAG: FG-GAP-like repeat-containing protein [Planctomycetota bacterium]|jgi:hypothetical protein
MNRFVGPPAVLCAVVIAIPAHGDQVLQFRDFTNLRFPAPTNEYSNQATLGDLDNDGDLDIIFANGGNFGSQGPAQTQRVYINDGAGFFTEESDRIGMSGWARGVELGDIDNDGDLDVIFAQDFNHVPQLFENDGNGNFDNITSSHTPNVSLSSSRAQFGDIDNDGDMDLFITNGGTSRFGCSTYRIYINDGTGHYTNESSTYLPGIGNICNNMDVIFGDIDGDFDLDARSASTGSNNSRLFVNDGAGIFSISTSIPTDASCYSYDFGDINGDGDLDLLGVNAIPGSSGEYLLENDGSGNFTNISGQISPNPSLDDNDSKFLDYDMDGDLDLLVGRLGTGGERLYENNGAGFFTQTSDLFQILADSTLDVVVGDLTNNGAFDVVTAQGESGSYTNRIYLNGGSPDVRAPRIIDTEQLPDSSDAGPFVVRAAILDDMTSDRNFFYQQILLAYTVNDGPTQSVEMMYSGGQIYRGVIPGAGCGTVEYWIEATDRAGNTGSSIEDARTFQIIAGGPVGDANGDGTVDVEDLVAVIVDWGKCGDCSADINDDGQVDVQDLVLVILNWGASC